MKRTIRSIPIRTGGQAGGRDEQQTGMVGDVHLVDALVERRYKVVAIFSPSMAFGEPPALEHVSSSVDEKTGIPIFRCTVVRRQAFGREGWRKLTCCCSICRTWGYASPITSMARLMDACAEHGKKMIVLDRPNPNGFYVDGPLLNMKYKSGVGWLPIPVVHGMTLGELALMINGEKWLPEGRVCDLTVVPCENYTHQTRYEPPIAPSPPAHHQSIYLYPSTCLFRERS